MIDASREFWGSGGVNTRSPRSDVGCGESSAAHSGNGIGEGFISKGSGDGWGMDLPEMFPNRYYAYD